MLLPPRPRERGQISRRLCIVLPTLGCIPQRERRHARPSLRNYYQLGTTWGSDPERHRHRHWSCRLLFCRLVYPEISARLRYPDSIPTLWFGLTHGDPLAIIALGLILLLATPVLRVAVSVVAFAVIRDFLYVAITLLVLFILISSFLLGLGGG